MKIPKLTNVKKIIIIFLLWRLILFLPLIAGMILIPFRSGFDFTHIILTKQNTLLSNPLVFPWANFDGVHYLDIAQHGYTTNIRFFPFYPQLIKLGASIINLIFSSDINYYLSGFILANSALLLSLILLYKLLRLDYSKDISFYSVILLLLFPTSFFLGSIYSESVFLFLCVASLFFTRKKNWIMASICAALASFTRITGIILLPVLLFELLSSKDKKPLWQYITILIAPLGTVAYALYNFFRFQNAFMFIKMQGDLNNGRSVTSFVFPPQTVYRYFKILISISPMVFEWWIAILELAVFIFSCFLIYLMWKKKIRSSYIVFTIFGLLIPVLSGTFSGLPRYILPLFPLFLIIALTKNKTFKIIYILVGIILTFILLTLFSRGYYVA